MSMYPGRQEDTEELIAFILEEWVEGPTSDITWLSEEVTEEFCQVLMNFGATYEKGESSPHLAMTAMGMLWPLVRDKALKSQLFKEWKENQNETD